MVIRQQYNKFQHSQGYLQCFNNLPTTYGFVSSSLIHHILTPVAYLRFPVITDGQLKYPDITTIILKRLIEYGYGKPCGNAGNHDSIYIPNIVENFHRFDVKSKTHFLYICIADVDPDQILDILKSIHIHAIFNH